MMKRAAVSGFALMTVLAGCSDERGEPVVVAAAPIPVERMALPETTTAVTEPATVAVRADVTYADAEAVFRKGRYEEAAGLFGVVVESQPSSPSAHYLHGLSAWKSGDRGTAERALTKAVELDGSSVKIRTNLSRVLLEQGRPQEALPHMEHAISIAPESHEVWRVLGNVYSQLGRGDDAIGAYREALILNDEDAWTMNNYGLVLIQQGRFEEALLPLARAVQLSPRSPVFQNNLGVALERTGQPGGAEAAFEAALSADSTYTRAQVSLERVRARLGTDERVMPDLSDLAQRFMDEMLTWIGEEEHTC